MRFDNFKEFAKFRAKAIFGTILLISGALGSRPLAAQQAGPISGAAPREDDGISVSRPNARPQQEIKMPAAAAAPQKSSGITNQPPSMPVEEIKQRFAARESEFKKERENFTYEQTFLIQTIDGSGRPDGEYQMTSDIVFTPAGKRYEQITYAPQPTLERIQLSQQDLDDLRNVQPFVLTTEDLPKYTVTYVGREQVDEIGTYVFDVGPVKLEKNQRYFQGRIWVDDRDLEIVKSDGKAVPDIRKGKNENVFPRFATYRENIEGDYWFPTVTLSDDVLHFSTGDVHIRMSVHYANYKRFGSTIRLIPTPQNK